MTSGARDLVMLTVGAGDLRRWQSDDCAQSHADGDETARMLALDVLPMGMCALSLDAASCLPFAQQTRDLFLSMTPLVSPCALLASSLAVRPVHT
jgi:hypothetical protein